MKLRLHKRRVLAALASLIIIGGGLATWLAFASAEQTAKFKTQPLAKGTLTQIVSANGTLNPVTLVSVGTQVSGTVKKLHVDFNSPVTAGQVLLELDETLFAAQVAQSQASLRNAEANLELAVSNENRSQQLFEKGFASRQAYDQAVQARKTAAAQADLAKATVAKDRATLGYAVIKSPISGVVVDRSVDVGQTVAASFQTPTLMKIAQDLTKMQINASFAEADIGAIKLGQKVKFNVDAIPNRSFQGEVRQIRLSPSTVQNVVTYDVIVSVDNADLVLLPGMTAYVSIAVAERKDALLVPNAALRFKPSNREATGETAIGERKSKKKDAASGQIYVLIDGQPKAVPVGLGITDNRTTEIVGGEIREGDAVILGENTEQAGGQGQKGANPMRLRLF
jgi:HlyD family secretion protein